MAANANNINRSLLTTASAMWRAGWASSIPGAGRVGPMAAMLAMAWGRGLAHADTLYMHTAK